MLICIYSSLLFLREVLGMELASHSTLLTFWYIQNWVLKKKTVEFNWILFCFLFFINHQSPSSTTISSPFISPSLLCLLFPSNTPNSLFYSVLEHLVSSPAGALFLFLSLLFTLTLTQIQKLPGLESLETQVHGWVDQMLLSNLQWQGMRSKLEFQIHYPFRKHFLYGQVFDYSSSRLGYLAMF